MDPVAELKLRLDVLPEGAYTLGLRAVLAHLEAAERHLERGRKTRDESLFTDAVYRTNHAFEGVLKEAYVVLGPADDTKPKSPYQIEKYFAEKSVLHPRVGDLFTRYRQDWRNPSTHDHVLQFTEAEAFLAILSVCAFMYVLIEQMVQRIAYRMAITQLLEEKSPKEEELAPEPLMEQIIHVLRRTGAVLRKADEAERPKGADLVGRLAGTLEVFVPNVVVQTEPAPKPVFGVDTSGVHPDLLVMRGAEKVVVDVKTTERPRFEEMKAALVTHIVMTGNTQGVMLLPYAKLRDGKSVMRDSLELEDATLEYALVV